MPGLSVLDSGMQFSARERFPNAEATPKRSMRLRIELDG